MRHFQIEEENCDIFAFKPNLKAFQTAKIYNMYEGSKYESISNIKVIGESAPRMVVMSGGLKIYKLCTQSHCFPLCKLWCKG